MIKKKIWANFFAQKFVTKLSKIWVWDPGSEIRDPEKTYSGSRGQKGNGSRIRNTDKKLWYGSGLDSDLAKYSDPVSEAETLHRGHASII
jgi:hypothetical protein